MSLFPSTAPRCALSAVLATLLSSGDILAQHSLADMPTSLSDLPLELLPEILAPLVSRRDLYNVCLVSRDWREVGQARLLRHVRLFGRDLVRKPTDELCRRRKLTCSGA